jgi:hypothetical protein
MIRYAITQAELLARIDARSPTWRTRAQQAEQRMRSAGAFDDTGPAWSDIKVVYIELQHNKCAYCERQLEDEEHGSIEHDVEHYRPKREVVPWQSSTIAGVNSGTRSGYFMLAYEPLNYCATCKVCNSTLKHQYFPISGKPGRKGARDIAKLDASEQPCLPYPIGDQDEDPETLLTFLTIVPTPTTKRGSRRKRAMVTIELLKLDAREQLLRERATLIITMWRHFEATSRAPDEQERQRARRQLDRHIGGTLPHTACARSFYSLMKTNHTAAYRAYLHADAWLSTH